MGDVAPRPSAAFLQYYDERSSTASKSSTWLFKIERERDSVSKEPLCSEPDSRCELLYYPTALKVRVKNRFCHDSVPPGFSEAKISFNAAVWSGISPSTVTNKALSK